MKKAHGSRKEDIACAECGSKNVVKKGRSKNKFQSRQIYKCKDCNKRFVSGFGKSYPAVIIMDSITAYNLGNNLTESSKIIKKKHKVGVPEKTIYSWVKEFDRICSYYRIRKKVVKLFKPKDVFFKKIFRHLQLYKYRYHKAKIELFVNDYFSGLKNYLADVSGNCPNELFKHSIRSSQIELNIDIDKIKVFKKENYACRLASLALESANRNSERHDKLQEFMIANDTCTIATEVPVYLFLDEIKEYGVLKLFEKNALKENSLNKNFNDKNPITENNHKGENSLDALDVKHVALHPPVNVRENSAKVITGHIDFVQLKFGSVYVLDYKPNADKVSAVSQLFVYAVALSVRTGIWLRNFRCAWFDENSYYEFAPSDIVLRFCKVPQHRFREFFVRNKERRYFTSKEFQQKRNLISKGDNNFSNISSGDISSIAQSRLDMAFGQRRELFNNFFGSHAIKHFKNLPEHYSSAIKGKCSAADFGVGNDVLVDLDSHSANSNYAICQKPPVIDMVACCLSQLCFVVFEHARKYTILYRHIGLTSISHRHDGIFSTYKDFEAGK